LNSGKVAFRVKAISIKYSRGFLDIILKRSIPVKKGTEGLKKGVPLGSIRGVQTVQKGPLI